MLAASNELRHDLGKRAEGDALAVGGAASDHRRRRPADPVDELARKSRLADPRGPDDRAQAADPLLPGAVEREPQLHQLASASDERRRERAREQRLRRAERDEPPREHLGPSSLHRERFEGLGDDSVLDQAVGAFPEQDLVRRGGLLEPGGDMDRIARRERPAARAAADEHLAGVDAHLHREPDAVVPLQLRGERSRGLAELEPGAHGPEGVVLVHVGQTEDADGGIADVLLHRAAVPLQRLPADRRIPVEHAVHRLRIQPFGERGRVDEVGEDDGHEPPRADHRPTTRPRRETSGEPRIRNSIASLPSGFSV
jgi:hypothetical protein